jgi:hypothetical protein
MMMPAIVSFTSPGNALIPPQSAAEHCEPEPHEHPLEDLEDPLEELIEAGYQRYLAERALQELFESGALQALGG